MKLKALLRSLLMAQALQPDGGGAARCRSEAAAFNALGRLGLRAKELCCAARGIGRIEQHRV